MFTTCTEVLIILTSIQIHILPPAWLEEQGFMDELSQNTGVTFNIGVKREFWCFFYIKVNMIFSKIKCILKGWKIIISYFIGRPTSACLHSLLCTLSSQSWPIYSSTVLYNYQTHSVYSLGLLYSSLEQCFLPPEIPFLHSLGQTLLHDCMQQNVSKLIGGSMH